MKEIVLLSLGLSVGNLLYQFISSKKDYQKAIFVSWMQFVAILMYHYLLLLLSVE
jgi:hypothetical protein